MPEKTKKIKTRGFTRIPNLVSGFTLIETLVAISILSLSIAATFTAVQNGISSSTYAKDQITAFYLAQEGMEFIRNVRDENALNSISASRHWLFGLASDPLEPCHFSKTCTIDAYVGIKNGGVAECSGGFGSCPVIKQNTNSSSPTYLLYGHTAGWTDTNFTREIQFTQITADEVLVTMRISWATKGSTKSFQVSESLFNH